MSKNKIGYNKDAERTYNETATAKLSILKQGIQQANKYVKIEDNEQFASDMHQYFIDAIEKKFREQFAPAISTFEMMRQMNINSNGFRVLQTNYDKQDADLNFQTLQVKKRNFDIYADNKEQADRWKLLNDLCTQLNKVTDAQIYAPYGKIIQAYAGAIRYDYSVQPNCYVPNINWIKQ